MKLMMSTVYKLYLKRIKYEIFACFKEVAHFGGRGQLMGGARNRTRARDQQEESCCSLPTAGTNSCSV